MIINRWAGGPKKLIGARRLLNSFIVFTAHPMVSIQDLFGNCVDPKSVPGASRCFRNLIPRLTCMQVSIRKGIVWI